MKYNTQKIDIETNTTIESPFRISDENSLHIIKILRDQLYSDKIMAVLREYCTNALDAHTEVGKEDIPIQVKLPTTLNPYLIVRDFGPGLSEDNILNIFSVYGSSTRRNTNEAIGQLGIGSKSGFCYADNFFITSWFGATKSVYSAYIDESEYGKIALLSREESNELSGLEIKIQVNLHDIYYFNDKAKELFRFFSTRPEVTPPISIPEIKEKYTDTINNIKFSILEKIDYTQDINIIMGDIVYKHNIESAIFNECSQEIKQFLRTEKNKSQICLFINIGDCSISASREALEGTKQNQTIIAKYLETAIYKIKENIERDILSSKTFREANEKLYISNNNFPSIFPLTSKNIKEHYYYRGRRLSGQIFPYVSRVKKIGIYRNHIETDQCFLVQAEQNQEKIIIFKISSSNWKKKLRKWIEINPYANNMRIFLISVKDRKDIDQIITDNQLQDYKTVIIDDIILLKEKRTRNNNKYKDKVFKYKFSSIWPESQNWEPVEEIIHNIKYYVPIDKFKIENKKDIYTTTTLSLQTIKRIIKFLEKYKNIKIIDLYGVKKSFKINNTWINILDLAKKEILKCEEEVIAKYTIDCTGTTLHKIATRHEEILPGIAKDYLSQINRYLKICSDQDILYLYEELLSPNEIKIDSSIYNTINRLQHIFTKEVINNISKRYILLKYSNILPDSTNSYIKEQDIDEIIKYINFIDGEKK